MKYLVTPYNQNLGTVADACSELPAGDTNASHFHKSDFAAQQLQQQSCENDTKRCMFTF